MSRFTYSLRPPIFFLVLLFLCASGLLLLRACFGTRPTIPSPATTLTAAMPKLEGEKATEYLQKNGLHTSLGAAMAEARYRVWPDPQQRGSFYANNAAQRLSASFRNDGVELRIKQGEQTERLSLRLQSVGYGVQQTPVTAGTLRTEGNRAEYTHSLCAANGGVSPVLTEWYVNTTAGLEQGFTLTARPSANDRVESLRIGLTMQAKWQAQIADGGQAVVWKDQRGRESLRYDKLKVTDADGHEIPAHMKVEAQQLWLEVQDAEARYPLTIDPLFTQTQKLLASDGAATDNFGSSVAISSDTAIVGAFSDDIGGNMEQGSAYIFARNQGGADNWGQVQKLTASDGAASDFFGFSVSISNDTAVIGAFRKNGGQGAAYIFERNMGGADNWGQVQKLTAADATFDDIFSYTVSISHDTVIVGAPRKDVGTNNEQGVAYIFERNTGGANNWGQVQKLTANDGAINDVFGHAVAINGDTAIVGANGDDLGSNANQGSAYIFERNTGGANNWGMVKKLTTTDGAASDEFGYAVAIYHDTVIITAWFDDVGSNQDQGSAYIFERNQGGANNWGQVQKLTASDGSASDRFGLRVAIDNDTVIVGAIADDVGSNQDQGSAYIFERNRGGANNWGQVQKLTASDGAADDNFGISVALSGDTAIVGAYFDDVGSNADQGSAYIFRDTCKQWVQIQKPLAADGEAGDGFGKSVAISGDTAIVGASLDDVGSNVVQGSAYIFERNQGGANSWGQVQKLTASDGADRNFFGDSVALSGDTAIVGANFANLNHPGSAYVFERNQGGTNNWGQVKKLIASDSAQFNFFGGSVAISNDTAVVGASWDKVGSNFNQGSAYVFERNQGGANNWGEVQKLTASDGAAYDYFGASVSLSDDTAIVGAGGDDVGSNADQGSAYIFARNQGGANNWGQVQKLTASDGGEGDGFGASVALSGDTAIVGAAADDVGSNLFQGSAYIFERNQGGANNWGQVQKLTVSDGAAYDYFGSSVAISGETAIVGAPKDIEDDNFTQGAVYIFERNTSGLNKWGQVQMLTASDGAPDDQFGREVAISGDTVIVGAWLDDVSGNADQGAAYIFTINCPPEWEGTPPGFILQQGTITGFFTVYFRGRDVETPLNNLTITVSGLPVGVVFSQLENNSVIGHIEVGCTVPVGVYPFTWIVTDENGGSASVSDTLTIIANTAPTLTYANPPVVAQGGALNVNPATGPADNGTFNLTVLNTGSYTGNISVNPAGIVSLSNIGLAGTHTITIRATDNCGLTRDASFMLTVLTLNASISDPIVCAGDNMTLSVHAEVTNPNNAPQNFTFNAPLNPPLSGIPGSCVVSGGTCTITNGNVNVTGTLAANQTITIDYKVRVANGTPPGTNLCITSTVTFAGGAMASVTACNALNCPGANPRAQAARPGSLVIFPYYTSNSAAQIDTRLTLSNVSASASIVHLFLLDGTTCQASDFFVCLTANASVSFKASDYDPEVTGYVLAVAVNAQGEPIQQNALLGNAFVNEGNYVGNYGATSLAARSPAVAALNPNGTATLFLDGNSYDGAPSQLAVEVQSPVDAPGQKVVLAGLRGDVTTSQMSGVTQVGTGLVINGNEKPVGSFVGWLNGNCQASATLTTTSPRVPGGLGVVVPKGQSGTITMNVGGAVGILLTPRGTAWSGIRGLHYTAVTATTITIPIFAPVC